MQQTTSTLRFALLITLASGFLDAYTYLVRGGVFANVQTANVIFMGIELSDRRWTDSLQHLWPILAFVLGAVLAAHIKSGRLDHRFSHPIRWTIGLQATVMAVVGFVPAWAPNIYVTVPIAFCAALTIAMFRTIGNLGYFPVATTGNLLHAVEHAYAAVDPRIDERRGQERTAMLIYAGVAGMFALGALAGATATHVMDVHAAWLPACFLALTLAFFVIDERGRPQS